jgi:undecaprenyl diphosphate synthase
MPGTKTDSKPLPSRVPEHIGIIMDGNGRWARKRGLPRIAGHKAGTENLRKIIRACVDFGIRVLTIYAFSTENWARPKDEVEGLMGILEDVVENETAELNEEGVRIRHIGRLEQLNPRLQKKILQAVDLTKDNQRLILCIAWNYGSRDELVRAVRSIISEKISPEEVDANTINQHLYTAGIPDPDLVIRTSGEMRTSNFLLWQSAYSEWYFTPTLWPDFSKEELRKALVVFEKRERRYGKTSDQLSEESPDAG